MASSPETRAAWLDRAARHLQALSASAGEDLHAGLRRLRQLHGARGSHIDTYRGMVDASGGCTLSGRVLARPLASDPGAQDDWWDNLLNSYRRYDAEHVAGARVEVTFRGHTVSATSDAEGYYEAVMPVDPRPAQGLWETAEVRRAEGGPVYLQEVLCVPPTARFGVISDIDDTILVGNGSHWQTAVQMTLLRNARTRKPLEGVGELYQAFQKGVAGGDPASVAGSGAGSGAAARHGGPNPVFYVSAGPWNVYDLLVDFMALNGLPPGPIALRDVDLAPSSLLHHAGPRGKLAKVHDIIARYPALQWVLVGDSAQLDAELYAQTVETFPGRILAVYIRDIDPGAPSARDQFVDGHITRIAGSKVPMLRVADSNAIAAHARSLGLIAPDTVATVAQDVQRDQAAPAPAQVVAERLAQAPAAAAAAVADALAGDGHGEGAAGGETRAPPATHAPPPASR